MATATAVMLFVFAAFALFIGVSTVTAGVFAALVERELAGAELLAFGVANLAGCGLMIAAGVGLLVWGRLGRALGVLCGGIGLLNGGAFVLIKSPGWHPLVGLVVSTLPFLLWVAFSLTCFNLMGKARYQPR